MLVADDGISVEDLARFSFLFSETYKRLPQEIQTWAADRPINIFLRRKIKRYFKTEPLAYIDYPGCVIVFDWSKLHKVPDSEIAVTVAHELCHGWLHATNRIKNNERQVEQYVKQWGIGKQEVWRYTRTRPQSAVSEADLDAAIERFVKRELER